MTKNFNSSFPLLDDGSLDLATLSDAIRKPDLFEPGLPLWTDPHICHQMLRYHLDPDAEPASRPVHVIVKQSNWILEQAKLTAGDCLLDLGCGPGLYAERFAQYDVEVTGIDISENSLAYARQQAQQNNLPITYRRQDFLTLDEEATYDAAIQVYGELSTFAPDVRDDLFGRIRRALKPGGVFIFDVSTPFHRTRAAVDTNWYIVPGEGFWKPDPHLVLERPFEFDDNVHVDQFVIVAVSGEVSVYRTWFLDYSQETIQAAVAGAGFTVEALTGGLAGEPLAADSEWIGVVARKEQTA